MLLNTSLIAITVERHCGLLTFINIVRIHGPGILSKSPIVKSKVLWKTSVIIVEVN